MAPSRRAECALAASRTVNLQFGRRVEIAVQSPHAHKSGPGRLQRPAMLSVYQGPLSATAPSSLEQTTELSPMPMFKTLSENAFLITPPE